LIDAGDSDCTVPEILALIDTYADSEGYRRHTDPGRYM
jgi:hypothetical protein